MGLANPLSSPSASRPKKSSRWAAVSEPTMEVTLSRRLPLKPVAKTITSASTSEPSSKRRPVFVYEVGRMPDLIFVC
jgi:hypothetical protein